MEVLESEGKVIEVLDKPAQQITTTTVVENHQVNDVVMTGVMHVPDHPN
eukprot:CAMPEP_0168623348 /NCGR_PEP_ID=MMETSP0449_2-20121227/8773_1 /TAXON_ID=1082188 /ORGANISM="Strombidium rassoulzadegani, Strain ras09" /LENGTH=48 /DNA_ID= /DNA_START= /DNA_END= /DNA_ORIENTATION=